MSSLQWDDAELDDLLHDPHGPVGQDLERRAVNGETEAKRLLSLPGTGRVYTTTFWTDSEGRLRRGRARPPHRASAPGEPPAVDTGHLRASVGHRLGEDADGMYAEYGTDLDIGAYLELGTRTIEPRPWLRPSLPATIKDDDL